MLLLVSVVSISITINSIFICMIPEGSDVSTIRFGNHTCCELIIGYCYDLSNCKIVLTVIKPSNWETIKSCSATIGKP